MTALLARNVTIAGTATVAYDLPPLATISGTVTLAGAPLPPPDDPAAGFRRIIFFRDLRSDRVQSFGVGGPSGPGTFTATLFAGNYDVTFENLTNAADSVPQGQSRLATNVAIAGDRTMVFDAPLATVSGRVTLGGAQLPNSPGLASRGTVILRETISGVTHELPIAGNGPGTFSGTVFAGRYTVTLKTDASDGLRGLPIAAERRLATGIEITGNRSLDYDVSVATVSGTVTLAGAAPADAGAARGAVVLDDKRTGSSHALPVTETGPATFSGLVFTGTYDVSYRTLYDGALGGLPANASTLVASDLAVTRDTTLAPNLETATVSGVVTVGGAALPDSPGVSSRGYITLAGPTGIGGYSFTVGKIGPGQFSGTVFAGRYAVGFFTPNMTALQGLPVGAETTLAEAMTLTGRPTLAFDLKLVQVSGTVTVDGAMMPETSGINRGEVVLHDKLTHDLRRFPVGSLGPARFSGTVFAANYDVAFETGPGYLTGLPVQAKTDIAQGLFLGTPVHGERRGPDGPVGADGQAGHGASDDRNHSIGERAARQLCVVRRNHRVDRCSLRRRHRAPARGAARRLLHGPDCDREGRMLDVGAHQVCGRRLWGIRLRNDTLRRVQVEAESARAAAVDPTPRSGTGTRAKIVVGISAGIAAATTSGAHLACVGGRRVGGRRVGAAAARVLPCIRAGRRARAGGAGRAGGGRRGIDPAHARPIVRLQRALFDVAGVGRREHGRRDDPVRCGGAIGDRGAVVVERGRALDVTGVVEPDEVAHFVGQRVLEIVERLPVAAQIGMRNQIGPAEVEGVDLDVGVADDAGRGARRHRRERQRRRIVGDGRGRRPRSWRGGTSSCREK